MCKIIIYAVPFVTIVILTIVYLHGSRNAFSQNLTFLSAMLLFF